MLNYLKQPNAHDTTIVSNHGGNSIWVLYLKPYVYQGENNIPAYTYYVSLNLCEMPSNVKHINVEWTVSIPELNFKKSKVDAFDMKHKNYKMSVGSFQQFVKCNSLTVNVYINIKNAININGVQMDLFNKNLIILQQKLNTVQSSLAVTKAENNELKAKNKELQLLITKEEETRIKLKTVLVVIICVGKYDVGSDQNTLNQLPGTQIDKERLTQLFKEKYDYDIIRNPGPYVTHRDMDSILSTARTKFTTPNKYDAVMVFFSGHGDEYNLFLSAWNKNKNEYYKYDRNEFEANFNGKNAPSKVQAFKFYFIDACRGMNHPRMIDIIAVNDKAGNGKHEQKDYVHPEKNRCIMHANPKTYKSYEVPYDEKQNDIAWDEMDNDVYDGKYCGIFMNAIYHAFNKNVDRKFCINFSDIQDNIRDKAYGAVPLQNDKACKVGLEIDESGALLNRDKRRIIFIKNEQQNVHTDVSLNIECL
eukprot:322434_1